MNDFTDVTEEVQSGRGWHATHSGILHQARSDSTQVPGKTWPVRKGQRVTLHFPPRTTPGFGTSKPRCLRIDAQSFPWADLDMFNLRLMFTPN